MKVPRKRIIQLILLTPLALFALVYIGAAVMLAMRDDQIAVLEKPIPTTKSIAILVPAEPRGTEFSRPLWRVLISSRFM